MKIVNHLEKDYTTAERHFRDSVETYSDANLTEWLKEQTTTFAEIEQAAGLPDVIQGRVLELGAGRSWFTALISRYPSVTSVDAVDISTRLMTEVAPKVIRRLKGEEAKITLHVADFSKLAVLGKNQFNTIIFDGAIHHASNPVTMLTDLATLLASGSWIVAIREPIVPFAFVPVTPLVRYRHGRLEKSYGVTENVFSLASWKKIFTRAGFHLEARPVPANPDFRQRLIGGQYVFVASRFVD